MEKNYVGLSRKGKTFWGPMIWGSMHSMAISFEKTQKGQPPLTRYAFENFITSIAFLLPCPECRNHFIDNLKLNALTDSDFESNVALFKWTWQLHNTVNKMLGKKEISFADAYDYWSQRL